MKGSTKIILTLATLLVLGVGGYFAFKAIEDYNYDKLKKAFEDKLKSQEIKNSAAGNPDATKKITQSEDGSMLVMTNTTTNEVIGETRVESGSNMSFPMAEEKGGSYTEYDNVKILQTFLLFANPDLVLIGGIDGKFGASTAAAVKQETEGFAAQAMGAVLDDIVDAETHTVGEMYGEYGYDPIYTTGDDSVGNADWDWDAMDEMYKTVTKQYYDEVVMPEYEYFTTL